MAAEESLAGMLNNDVVLQSCTLTKICLGGNHKRLDHMSVEMARMAGRLSPTRNEGDVIAKPAQSQH